MPIEDPSQDYAPLGGYQNDTHTVLRFSRPWDTCDEDNDLKLGENTVKLIWAYSEDEDKPVYHGVRRGVRSMLLKGGGATAASMRMKRIKEDPDVKVWEVRANEQAIPQETDTMYGCQIVKVPFQRHKHHIVAV